MAAGEVEVERDYVGLLSEMCDDFELFQQRKKFAPNPDGPLHVRLLYGLNCHAHYMARRCLPLLAESTIAAVPIVRSVFECGVMAQWLRWFPGSDDSLLEEGRRQMMALTKELSRAESTPFSRARCRLPRTPL